MTTMNTLNYYNDLSSAAQAVARSNVIASEETAYKSSIRNFKRTRINTTINARINGPSHIQALVRQLRIVRKYQCEKISDVESWITSNLCMFDKNGRYYLFTRKAFY